MNVHPPAISASLRAPKVRDITTWSVGTRADLARLEYISLTKSMSRQPPHISAIARATPVAPTETRLAKSGSPINGMSSL